MIHRYQEMSRYWRHWILQLHTIHLRLQVRSQNYQIHLHFLHSRTHRRFLLIVHHYILEAQHLQKFVYQPLRYNYNNPIDIHDNQLIHQHSYMGSQRCYLGSHHHRPLLF